MTPGVYFRVHPTLMPGGRPGELLSPLAANPHSMARFALRGDQDRAIPPRRMFYVATSPAAALLEALLRPPLMSPGRRINLNPQSLKGNTLSTVLLRKPAPYVPLMKPDRALVVTDPAKDEAWRYMLGTPNHAETHQAAADVADQFSRHVCDPPLILSGFGYPSQQHSQSLVYLLYEPPMEPCHWHVTRSVNLSTAEGRRAAIVALAEVGLLAFDDSDEAESIRFKPPFGAV